MAGILASDVFKALAGFTGGMLVGQNKIMRIPGNPTVCTGEELGLPPNSIKLIDRSIEHVVTDRDFLRYLYGPTTQETEHTVPAMQISDIPYIKTLDYRDRLYLRIR